MTQLPSRERHYRPHEPVWQRFDNAPSDQRKSNGGMKKDRTDQQQQQHPYNRQYSHVYSLRLAALRDSCLSSSSNVDGVAKAVPKIIELQEGVQSIVVGTVVKKSIALPLASPSSKITLSLDHQNAILDPMSLMSQCSEEDELVLEDDSGRVELVPASPKTTNRPALDFGSLATGVVVAVAGIVMENTGVFQVQSIHFPQIPMAPTHSSPIGVGADSRQGARVLLLSGLHCGEEDRNALPSLSSLRRDMLLDYLAGRTYTSDDELDDEAAHAARVCRVIVAGGGCAPPSSSVLQQQNASTPTNSAIHKKSKSTFFQNDDDSNPIRELDLFLAELCSSGLPVDYIPSFYDPTNANWPQRPIHSCLFPNASTFVDLFRRSPNPYEARIGPWLALGTDGHNVLDLRRFMCRSSNSHDDNEETTKVPLTPSEALGATLQFGHICPTGPDSVPTFPAMESDPFVLSERPHIYFAGNCPQFETDVVGCGDDADDTKKQTRLICIPKFADTGEAVLLDLDTLTCELLTMDLNNIASIEE